MKRSVHSLSLVAAIAPAMLLTACGAKPVVGILLPETGAAASYGKSMRHGIALAVEQAKADGSYPDGLALHWADSGTDPDRAVTALRDLAGRGCKLVVAGVTSGEATPLLPVLEETQVVMLSPSASAPNLTKDSRLFFRIFTSDDLEGRRAGRFLREDQDRASVLILSEDSAQARGIEPPFRQVFEQSMVGKVVGRVLLTDPAWEQQTADMVLAHNPESAYVLGYADSTVRAIKQLRKLNFQGVICATSAFYSGDVVDRNPGILEGVYFPQPAFDLTDDKPLVQRFIQSYQAKYGSHPDIYAAHAFDSMKVAMHVVDEVAVFESSELRKAMMFSIKEFPGVTGIIQFNDYGDVHRNPIMFVVKEGEVRNYERWVDEEKQKIRDRIRNLLSGRPSAPTPTPAS